MKKNVLIINYNTQKLTEACIKSVNKFTPGCTIYVFDNSDNENFINNFNNVIVMNNTSGQIIDFKTWLEKYKQKERSTGKINNWASAKHSYSVETFMKIIGEPFLLLDSDVLLKKDVSELFESSVCCVGESVFQGKKSKIQRILPFITYINTPLCKEKGIHYFDENYMNGLKVSITGDKYDTGAAFFLSMKQSNINHREIKTEDFIVHFGGGSWLKKFEKLSRKKHISVDEWLEKNRDLWDENLDGNLTEVSRKSTPEPESRHVPPEEKVMPVVKKKEVEVKYLKMAKTSDRKIGVLKR